MISREMVCKAIEFNRPPRLPFWQHDMVGIPDDVCDCWEMDRAKRGWFFDHPVEDDWGCVWSATEQKNMGQVIHHPLEQWGDMAAYCPPDPCDPFYFDRLDAELAAAGDRYVVVTSHFNLIERLHMLHGFADTLRDFYLAPRHIEIALDMILNFKLDMFHELHRRYGDRVDGLFLTDDWGTQQGTFVSGPLFEDFFLNRYRILANAIHGYGWHVFLHSCGRINDFLPYFIDVGIDVMNMQQPQANGIEDIGRRFAGKIAFLTTADIQSTLPTGDPDRVRAEVRELLTHWGTPDGGFVVFNYGDPEALGIPPNIREVMFGAFAECGASLT